MKKDSVSALEKALWSVALPGLGQLLNQKYLKGVAFIVLEILINMNANINTVIIGSFYGDIPRAIEQTNYQWLMFYPCLYMFAIWDAYRDGIAEELPLLFLPFVLSAYTGTVAVIYSFTFRIGGILIGPIFLPILTIIFTMGVGLGLRHMILKRLTRC